MKFLSVEIPDSLERQLQREKKRLGLSKSDIVRQILIRHFAQRSQKTDAA